MSCVASNRDLYVLIIGKPLLKAVFLGSAGCLKIFSERLVAFRIGDFDFLQLWLQWVYIKEGVLPVVYHCH